MPDEKYPGNSFISSSIDPNKKKPPTPEKIIKGTVKTHKKSLGQKFVDTFLAEDIGRAIEHVFYDVFIPKAKDIISDSVDMMLFGNPRKGGGSRPIQGSYVSYSEGRNAMRRPPAPTIRGLVDNITFDNAEDAHDVLADMRAYVSQYGVVTVGYMYGLLGYPSDQTKENYGWYNIEDAAVVFTPNGYMLRLPRPILLTR